MPFTAGVPPQFEDVNEATKWFVGELERLARELSETIAVELRHVHAAPANPREGMIVSADGTDWNPGSGGGAYEYLGGVWVKL